MSSRDAKSIHAAPLREDELANLPVFPLPRAVFFPGTILPLHLFEPRYRALAEDCVLRGPKAMAIALLEPGYEADYAGRPNIHHVAGAGRVIAHERNTDGTYDIVLRGMSRVHLDEHLSGETPYRRARATVLETLGVARADAVTTLLACATSVATVVRQQHPEFELGVSPSDPPEIVADAIADRFVSDTAARQAILEARDISERLRLVTDAVGELLAMLAATGDPS